MEGSAPVGFSFDPTLCLRSRRWKNRSDGIKEFHLVSTCQGSTSLLEKKSRGGKSVVLRCSTNITSGSETCPFYVKLLLSGADKMWYVAESIDLRHFGCNDNFRLRFSLDHHRVVADYVQSLMDNLETEQQNPFDPFSSNSKSSDADLESAGMKESSAEIENILSEVSMENIEEKPLSIPGKKYKCSLCSSSTHTRPMCTQVLVPKQRKSLLSLNMSFAMWQQVLEMLRYHIGELEMIYMHPNKDAIFRSRAGEDFFSKFSLSFARTQSSSISMEAEDSNDAGYLSPTDFEAKELDTSVNDDLGDLMDVDYDQLNEILLALSTTNTPL